MEYEQLLIDYLERFLGDLVLATNEISQKILLVEWAGIGDQFRLVAQRALTDSLLRTSEGEEQEQVDCRPVSRANALETLLRHSPMRQLATPGFTLDVPLPDH